MGETVSKLFQAQPTEKDRIMAAVTIPVGLEANLSLGDGSTGYPVQQAIQLKSEEIPNLYCITGEEFKLSFQEHGVAYNETEASEMKAEVTIKIKQGVSPGFSLSIDTTNVVMWGINYAGKVVVKHDGEERCIYLPGTRTYDPAGITGDPHASERIGPSCSRTQLGITIAQLVAVTKGAEQLNEIQDQFHPIVERYHGRLCLFEWMKQQIEEAVLQNKDVTPYPEFIKGLIRNNKLELGEGRQHTREYLESYNVGLPHPPVQYFQKVAKKDKIEELLNGEELTKFKSIIGAS